MVTAAWVQGRLMQEDKVSHVLAKFRVARVPTCRYENTVVKSVAAAAITTAFTLAAWTCQVREAGFTWEVSSRHATTTAVTNALPRRQGAVCYWSTCHHGSQIPQRRSQRVLCRA